MSLRPPLRCFECTSSESSGPITAERGRRSGCASRMEPVSVAGGCSQVITVACRRCAPLMSVAATHACSATSATKRRSVSGFVPIPCTGRWVGRWVGIGRQVVG